MRILVMLLLDTLPMLGNVLLLCFFVFFIFGIIGVQLWSGLLRNRCFLNLPDNISVAWSVPSILREWAYLVILKIFKSYECLLQSLKVGTKFSFLFICFYFSFRRLSPTSAKCHVHRSDCLNCSTRNVQLDFY